MKRYIEYDTTSGRIISEIKSKSEPEPTAGKAILEIGETEKLDISRYGVRNGVLVKVIETMREKKERQRIEREHSEKCNRRLRAMMREYVLAQLDEDVTAQESLKREYKKIKRYI